MPNLTETEYHSERNSDAWRNSIEGLLKVGYGRFTFQKVDGSIRIMRCTLKPDIIPETKTTTLKNSSKPGLLVVYDVEAEGWRTVKYEKVINWIYLGNESFTDTEHESTWTQE